MNRTLPNAALLPLALVALSLPGHGAIPYGGGIPLRPGVTIGGFGLPGISHGSPGRGYGSGYGYGSPVPGYGTVRPLPILPYGTPYGMPAPYSSPTATYDYNHGGSGPYGVAELPPSASRGCSINPTRVLIGAALGGLSSAALAPNGRSRSWAVPVGAAIGGLGALATGGC